MVGHCEIYLFALFSTVVEVLKLLLKMYVVYAMCVETKL